ncbi:MAG TPA: TIGR04211 family SH3 domain-containing protein [Gammaproteobacteria bacterium]|nr:TIGR04211 family SH3 domain-containing protein [Gammaproteobacteria bacterium]
MQFRWVGLMFLLLAASAQAQMRYVSDRTNLELRRGASTEHAILRWLEPGNEVQVLEQDQQSGWSRVRVVDQGTEGWILTRFLMDEPSARDRLAAAERSLAAARERVATLEAQSREVGANLGTARTELEQTRTSHATVSKELADLRTAAANVVEIRDQNASLQQRLIERERDVDVLTAENARLAGRTSQNWFIVGASVLLAGIVIGLVAPTLRRRRRSDW